MNAIGRTNTTDAERAFMYDDAAEMLRSALAIQGQAALIANRDHAARHEAGHTVQYTAEGIRVLKVAIFRRGPAWLGQTNTRVLWRADQDTDPQEDMVQARCLLAGPLAEWFYCPRPALGAGVDEIALARAVVLIAARKTSEDYLDLLKESISRVLKTLEYNRAAFDQLSTALMRTPKIKGFPLLRLLECVKPAVELPTPPQLKDFVSASRLAA